MIPDVSESRDKETWTYGKSNSVKRICIRMKKIFRIIHLDWNKNTNDRRYYSITVDRNSKLPNYLKAENCMADFSSRV